MKQVVQAVSNGELRVVDITQPNPGPTEVLVATRRSLLSAGTERAVRELASASLYQKAKARPDLVRQVISKAKANGIRSTISSVRARLDEDMPLGYSAAGVAVTVGTAVDGIRPGMRVATASAGHAEYQLVPGLLTVPIPDGVTDEAAAFGAVAGIALQGIRQADVGLGSTVAVIGLGLVGQLTTRLALAAGLRVVGIDLRDWTAELASGAGATGLVEAGSATTDRIMDMTRGRGVDAVLITAATRSSEPVARATHISRDRGRIVVVGDVGLELDRRRFYEHELELRFARSYGPGRYDRSYEEWGVDYPLGYVRWTEGRNIEAYLDLVAAGRVRVDDLVTHVFPVAEALTAYERLAADQRALAIQLSYKAPEEVQREPIRLPARRKPTSLRAGIIGAGTYAKATFMPALKAAGWGDSITAVTSARGLSARHLADKHGIERVLPTAEDLIGLEDMDVVFILSSHDTHADLVVKALGSGKHVFVEKPLALNEQELDAVRMAYSRSERQLMVGFNRRYSSTVNFAVDVLARGAGPLTLNYRINAGPLPANHWYHDRRHGGRILGEMCHFVDLVAWICGEEPKVVSAIGSTSESPQMVQDVATLIGFPNGSVASISYSVGGSQATSKERLEILGRGRTITIEDFRRLEIDERCIRGTTSDKGHSAQLEAFRLTLQGKPAYGGPGAAFASTKATCDIVASIRSASG